MIARNRFIHADVPTAIARCEIQSNLAVDAIETVKAFPWIYTNAGCLAEAAAHWAFTAHPELRVDDEY